MANKMSDSLNAGLRWYCGSTRTPTGTVSLGSCKRICLFSNCPAASGSWQGANLHCAVYRRKLHQARNSYPSHIPWVHIWNSVIYSIYWYCVVYDIIYCDVVYGIIRPSYDFRILCVDAKRNITRLFDHWSNTIVCYDIAYDIIYDLNMIYDIMIYDIISCSNDIWYHHSMHINKS